MDTSMQDIHLMRSCDQLLYLRQQINFNFDTISMPDYSSDCFFSSHYNPHTDRSTFYKQSWGLVRPRETLSKVSPLSFFHFFKETYETGRA